MQRHLTFVALVLIRRVEREVTFDRVPVSTNTPATDRSKAPTKPEMGFLQRGTRVERNESGSKGVSCGKGEREGAGWIYHVASSACTGKLLTRIK